MESGWTNGRQGQAPTKPLRQFWRYDWPLPHSLRVLIYVAWFFICYSVTRLVMWLANGAN